MCTDIKPCYFSVCNSDLVERGTWRRKATASHCSSSMVFSLLPDWAYSFVLFRREVQGCYVFHLCTFGSAIHEGYCFLPDLSAEKADELKEDSRCSQAMISTQSHTCPVAPDQVGEPTPTTQHWFSLTPWSQHLPVPTAQISEQPQVRGQENCEDAYGGVGYTHRHRERKEKLTAATWAFGEGLCKRDGNGRAEPGPQRDAFIGLFILLSIDLSSHSGIPWYAHTQQTPLEISKSVCVSSKRTLSCVSSVSMLS